MLLEITYRNDGKWVSVIGLRKLGTSDEEPFFEIFQDSSSIPEGYIDMFWLLPLSQLAEIHSHQGCLNGIEGYSKSRVCAPFNVQLKNKIKLDDFKRIVSAKRKFTAKLIENAIGRLLCDTFEKQEAEGATIYMLDNRNFIDIDNSGISWTEKFQQIHKRKFNESSESDIEFIENDEEPIRTRKRVRFSGPNLNPEFSNNAQLHMPKITVLPKLVNASTQTAVHGDHSICDAGDYSFYYNNGVFFSFNIGLILDDCNILEILSFVLGKINYLEKMNRKLLEIINEKAGHDKKFIEDLVYRLDPKNENTKLLIELLSNKIYEKCKLPETLFKTAQTFDLLRREVDDDKGDKIYDLLITMIDLQEASPEDRNWAATKKEIIKCFTGSYFFLMLKWCYCSSTLL